MKPVIIIAIAFVFLIPLLISLSFAESDCIRLDGKVVTMVSENEIDDYVLIQDNLIIATGKINEKYPDNINCNSVNEIKTNGIIFPGLINIHNHPDWNVFPLWTVPEKYETRYEWRDDSRYKRDVKEPHDVLKEDYKIEMMKFAEVKALVGGTTAIQGTSKPYDDAFTKILVRNIEQDFDINVNVKSLVGEIKNNSYYKNVLKDIQNNDIQVLIQHLAEGTNGTAKDEFTTLKNVGLLREEVVIIHGTALGIQEFEEMANSKTKLAWSPLSNLLLYGNTTDVDDAWKSGVLVSLTSDWSPSGSKNILWELKVADWWNEKSFDGFFSDYELVKMVTVNPAIAIDWENYVGKIAPNYLADFVVINGHNEDPYRALVDASDSDVLLVMINGEAIYGTKDLMQNLGKNEFDEVGCPGWIRVLDTTNPLVDKGDQTWNDIIDTLEQEMNSNEFKDLLSTKSPYYYQVLPTPLFSSCDDDFIKTLQQSNNEDFSGLIESMKEESTSEPEQIVCPQGFEPVNGVCPDKPVILQEPPLEIIEQKVPWTKNIFGWYSQDLVSEDELLNAIQYLINEGILVVD